MSNYVYMGATPFSTATTRIVPKAGTSVAFGKIRFTAKNFTKTDLTKGRLYLAQQWVTQEQIVRNMRLSFPKPTAVKKPDGKVSVPVTSFWSDWNKQAAKAFQPVAPAIRSLDLLPRDLREKMVTRPLDALIDIFDPLFDRVAAPCRRTMQKHLRGGRRVEWFGRYIDIRIEQPAIDNKSDISTKTLLKKLRTIQAFIVCFIKKPLEFTAECLAEGIDLVGNVAESVGKAVEGAVETLGKAAESAGKAVGEVAKKAADEGEKAAAGVVSFFKDVGKAVGLGEAATGISGAIAAAITTVAGVVAENLLIAIIGAIVTVIMGAIGATAAVLIAFRQQESFDKALESGAPVEQTTKMSDGTELITKANMPPEKVDPKKARPESLADNEIGPAGAPPPPAEETLKAESASSPTSGFPILPVALAAGVALFFIARR